ncbi:MAG: PD-(D/E)XK nuclease family protein [Atribacterota bacterium]|nr:PD-(D/E)XK nuclease family protein [Atribacterota bacterium]
MYQFLSYLQNLDKQYLFQKKIILVPSYLDGNALRKNLTLNGFSALNFNIATLFDIAREICLPVLLKNGWKILDSTLGQILVLEILRRLSSEEKLTYFKLPFFSPLLAKSIFRTIKEIRVSGYSSLNFPREILTNSPKMNDLFLVMLHYEQELKERNVIDEAELYHNAEKLKSREKEIIFLVPSNLPLNKVELRFFNKKIRPNAFLLQFNCPEVMAAPHYFPLTTNQGTTELIEESIFNALYHREEIDSLPLPFLDIEFCQTYGEYNETREVLRTIIKEGYSFDQVQVFYATQEPYSQYFYQLSRLYQIPMTFHSGINIKNSHPAQFLLSLLDWINDNYSVAKLITLLNSSCIDINLKDSLTIPKFVSLLRESPIGWGRERYIQGINMAIEDRKKIMENISQEKARALSKEIQYLLAIKDWIMKIFTEIPYHKFQHRISLSQLAGSLARMVERYALVENNNIDEEAISNSNQKLGALEQNISAEFPINEALFLIKNIIEQERVNCSLPMPGHLHIASYKKGIWFSRFYTFLVGMDYQKFPGSSEEEVVLLETEKELFKHLLSNNQKNKMEQLRLLQLILAQRGKIYLSFSCYDTTGQREQAPANLMLQLYRLQKKNIHLDYSVFYQSLSPVRNFIPQSNIEILDEGELFLYFTKKEKRDLQLIFNQKYSSFQKGIQADKIRREEGFNVFNGRININTSVVDPRQNRGIVLSASRLERIAYCPYLYLLVDILKIKPVEEMVYDPTTWLGPLERGSLLHQIYEKFYQVLLGNSKGKKIAPSFSQHWSLLEEIIEESLAEKRRYLAPPGELIYEAEKKEIVESCQVFLAEEEENYKGQFPQYFELAFGTRDSQHEILGKVKAIELNLPDGGRISLQGKIDRVDLLPDGTFRIIDYKTGVSKDYRRRNPFRHGQQIQHALYAIALEKILAKKERNGQLKVSESGYYFPTMAGQGNLVLYKQDNREQVLEIIQILLNIVARGNFAMIQNPDELMCLDYKDILEQNEVIILKGEKGGKYHNEPALEEIRRLQQFE